MEFKELIELGYKHFGSEAMNFWNQFVSGEIDWDTCCKAMSKAYTEHIMADVDVINNTNKVLDVMGGGE